MSKVWVLYLFNSKGFQEEGRYDNQEDAEIIFDEWRDEFPEQYKKGHIVLEEETIDEN